MHFRRYLIAGLLVWIPIGFTLFVLNLVIGLMDRTLLLLPLAYQPEHLLGIKIPGLGILLSIIVLLLTGMLVALKAFRRTTLRGVEGELASQSQSEITFGLAEVASLAIGWGWLGDPWLGFCPSRLWPGETAPRGWRGRPCGGRT